MKISKIETFVCNAGWRAWIFVKVITDEGIAGWSECTESNGSPRGVIAVIKDLEVVLIGKDPRRVEKLYWEMYSITRQSPGGVVQKAIAGIENALLDIKAKALEIPVYELLGGPIRNSLPVYWSHFGTTRLRAPQFVNTPPLRSLSDIMGLCHEVTRRGIKAVKTNILLFGSSPQVYMPGFGKGDGVPELNVSKTLIKEIQDYMSALRMALGSDVDIILDLNFNFKTEGYIQIARALEPFGLLWLELDSYDPRALAQIKQSSRIPICSGENLYTTRDYRPYFEQHAMDIVSVDVIWNGLLQAKKIADMAEVYEMNVTPHNYYSHLAGIISAHFCAVIPNFRILEVDIDDVPWKDELVINPPKIENGYFHLPVGPGWGTDINEEVVRAHPWLK